MGLLQPKASNLMRAPLGPFPSPVSNSDECQRPKRKNNILQQRSENEAKDLISAPLWSQIAPLTLKSSQGPQVDMLLPLLNFAILLSLVPKATPLLEPSRAHPWLRHCLLVPAVRNIPFLDLHMADSFLCSGLSLVSNFLFPASSLSSVPSYFILFIALITT